MPREIIPRLSIPTSFRHFPSDLLVTVVTVTVLSVLIFLVDQPLVRSLLAFPIVLFAPGYTFIAALFPKAVDIAGTEPIEPTSVPESVLIRFKTGLSRLERIGLSFGASLIIVPAIGLVLTVTPWGNQLLPFLLVVIGFTVVVAVIGAVRRWRLPESERFSVPFRQWSTMIRAGVFDTEISTDTVVSVVLVVCLLLTVGSVAYALAEPSGGENFTEFYLLSKNGSTGYTASNYPSNITVGNNATVYVGVENHEHHQEHYTVVAVLQRVREDGDSTTVQHERELARFDSTVKAGGTWRKKHSISPRMTGDRLRLEYLLYKGSPPTDPNVQNAYREVHLRLNVSR